MRFSIFNWSAMDTNTCITNKWVALLFVHFKCILSCSEMSIWLNVIFILWYFELSIFLSSIFFFKSFIQEFTFNLKIEPARGFYFGKFLFFASTLALSASILLNSIIRSKFKLNELQIEVSISISISHF